MGKLEYIIEGKEDDDKSGIKFSFKKSKDGDLNILANGYQIACFDSNGVLQLTYQVNSFCALPLDKFGRIAVMA